MAIIPSEPSRLYYLMIINNFLFYKKNFQTVKSNFSIDLLFTKYLSSSAVPKIRFPCFVE